MRRAGIWILHLLAWPLVTVLAITASVLLHIGLPEARSVVRRELEQLVPTVLRGGLDIGRLDYLSPWEVRATEVVWLDEQGRVVISADTVRAVPDWRAIRQGHFRFALADFTRPTVVLHVVGEDGLQVSLVESFMPRDQGGPSNAEPPHITLDGMRIRDGRVVGDIPRFPNFGLEHVDLDASLDDRGPRVQIRTYGGTATMVAPYPGETQLEHIVLQFDNTGAPLLNLYAEANRGASHARARALLFAGEDDGTGQGQGPMRLELHAQAEPLDLQTINDLGFSFARPLAGLATGHVYLHGPVDRLLLESHLTHEAGLIHLTGNVNADTPWEFDARGEGIALGVLVPQAPAVAFTGHGHIVVPRDGSDPTVLIESSALDVLGYAVPAMTVRGHLTDTAFVVEEASAPHLDGSIRTQGSVTFDGAVDVVADVDVSDIGQDPNVQRLVPGAHGAVRGRVEVRTATFSDIERVHLDVGLSNFRYGAIRVRRGRAVATIRGPQDRLTVDIVTRGSGLTIGGLDLGTFDASIRGGPRAYRFAVASSGGADVSTLALDGHIDRVGQGAFEITLARYQASVRAVDGGPPIPLEGRDVVLGLRGGEVTFTRAGVRGFGEAVIEGAVSSRAARHLRVRLPLFPLELLRPFLPPTLSTLSGQLALEANLDGPFTDPAFTARVELTNTAVEGTRPFSATLTASYANHRLDVHADGDVGSGIYVHGAINAPFSALSDPTRWIREARFENFDINLDQANIAVLTPLLGENIHRLGLSGKGTVALRIDGPLSDPSIPLGVLVLDRFTAPGWSPLRIKLAIRYEHSRLFVERLWIADLQGELLLAEANAQVPVEAPAEGRMRHGFAHPWSASVRISPRIAEEWPRPMTKYLPRGMIFGGSVIGRGDGEDVTFALEATARFTGESTHPRCQEQEQPVVQLSANLSNEAADAHLNMFADRRRVAVLDATASVPIRRWIREDVPVEAPVVALSSSFDDVPLGRLPWACERVAGRLNGRAEMQLFAPDPSIDATLEVRQLRIRDSAAQASRPYHLAMTARSTGEDWSSLGGCLGISDSDIGGGTPVSQCSLPHVSMPEGDARSTGNGPQPAAPLALEGEALLRFAFPVRFDPRTGVPSTGIKNALYLDGSFSSAHLEPLLAWVPAIGGADVIADGRIVGDGSLEALPLRGGVELSDGHLRLVSIGQYLDGISGHLEFDGEHIVMPDAQPLVVFDTGHRAALRGMITMDGITPRTADVSLVASEFPARREGAIVAVLDGTARAHATIGKNGLDATVTGDAVEVRIPDRAVGSVIGVEPHPDVMVVGGSARELLLEGISSYPYRLTIRTGEHFVVRRNDFEVEVEADLRARYDDPTLSVSGTALLRGGYFEMFGKRLIVQRGALRFEEDDGFDPAVDLLATYAIPGRSGGTVSIEVGGRLSAPVIRFSSTETNDVGAIVAMLVSAGGGSTEESAIAAGGAATNLLSGLVVGLFMLSLRREFGDLARVIPAVTIASEGGALRANARWSAYDLIPEVLRDFVTDFVVEGAYRAGATGGGSAGSEDVGAALDFGFPYNFRARVTGSVGQSYGFDVAWQP